MEAIAGCLGAGPVADGKRVLVMDDMRAVGEVACRLLESLGHRAHWVASGEAALEAYRLAHEAGEPFDIVLLDLTVPGGAGGVETVRTLRALHPAICAVAMSGYPSGAVLGDYARYGFQAAIKKPFGRADLARCLDGLIRLPGQAME